MSGRYSRNKGKRGERAAVAMLREALDGMVDPAVIRRGYQARGGREEADVVVPHLHVECKWQERPNIHAALAQLERDMAEKVGFVIAKRAREKPLVAMRWVHFVPLLRAYYAHVMKGDDDAIS